MSEPTVEPRAVTPAFGWHLPVLGDTPNIPYDMQETALDIEATVAMTSPPGSALPYAAVDFTAASVGGGLTRLVTTANPVTNGGMTITNGMIRVPYSGVYLVIGSCATSGAGYAMPVVANETVRASDGGYSQHSAYGGKWFNPAIFNVAVAKPDFSLAVNAGAALSVTGRLSVLWQGKI
jgi:hypothetical protein